MQTLARQQRLLGKTGLPQPETGDLNATSRPRRLRGAPLHGVQCPSPAPVPPKPVHARRKRR